MSSAVADIAVQCGYEPHVILNSRKFSRAYRATQPSLIFMDLFMPDLDGMEMVIWLIDEKNRTKVIMTAKNSPEMAAPAVLVAEASDLFEVQVLTYPVSEEDIRTVLLPS